MRSSKRKPAPAGAEPRLVQALAEISSALRDAGVPWMVIGGIAIIARGVRRMTTDIDVVVRGDETTPAAMLRAFARRRIVPRIEDAEAFARDRLVLLLHHEPTGVDLDLSFGWTSFEHEALAARSDAPYGSVVVPMARAEDLVIFKAMAARPKDIEDAAALLLMHREIDLARVRRNVAELAELADEPSLATGLEAVIALAAAGRASRSGVEPKPEVRPPRAPKSKPTKPKPTKPERPVKANPKAKPARRPR